MYPTSEHSRKIFWPKRIRRLLLSSLVFLVFPKNLTIFSKNPSQSAPVVSSSEKETRSEHLMNTCSEFEPSENISRLTNEWNLNVPYSKPRLSLDQALSNKTPSHQNCPVNLRFAPCYKRKLRDETNSWTIALKQTFVF